MLIRMRTLLTPPGFAGDAAKTRAASILYPLLLLILAALSSYIALALLAPATATHRPVVAIPGALAILALLTLVRRGHVRLASLSLTALIWLIISSAMLLGGGVWAPAFAGLSLVVICAGILLSWRAALRFAILCVLTGTAFWYATIADRLPTPYLTHTPTSIWATSMLILGVATVLLSRARLSIDMPLQGHIYRVPTLPVTNAQGAVTGGMVVSQDITADKQAEVALKESKERAARLADATFEGIGFCENNILFDANARLAEMLGYTLDEMIGMPTEQLVAPESRDLVRRRVAAGYQELYEHLALHKDGTVFPVEVRSRPLQHQGRTIRVTVVRDISARVAAQHQLAASELRFRSAFHANPTPQILTHAADGTFLDVNAAYERLMGYSRSDLLGTRTTDLDLWVDLDRAALMAEMAADGRVRERPTSARDRAGKLHDLILSIEPVQVGETPCLLCVMIDVTEQKQAEAALMESEDRYRSVVAALAEGIMLFDTGGRPQTWNASAERILGLAADQLRVMTLDDPRWRLSHEDGTSFSRADNPLLITLQTGRPCTDVPMVVEQTDGTRTWLAVSTQPLRAPSPSAPSAVVASFTDITARKRAEETLADREARLRAIFEYAAIGIALLDMQGYPIESNPALNAMLGYTTEELRAMPFAQFAHADDMDADVALFAELVAGAREFYAIQKRYIRKDGQVVWGHLRVSLIRDGGGVPQFAIGMAEDITERKRIEQQYLQAQKMDSIGRLAGGIAHDFNNLLTIILGNTDMLLEELETAHPFHHDIAQIRDAADRATTLTRQLLAFSRKQMLVPSVVDLNAVVAGIAPLLRRLIGEDITLTTRCAPDLGRILSDAGQLEQVIVNLAVNARDAMEGGGTLIIETANAMLDTPAAGDYVLLAVSDTGCGMDAHIRERVFEPFFTTKAAGKGTGLGLATVYGIITQSGGHIWVYSEVGQGTTFKMYLPRNDRAEASVEDQVALAVNDDVHDHATILLVEDDAGVRDLVSRILHERGYQVYVAADAQEALGVAAASPVPIDLLLTDMIMPGGTNGVALAAQLQDARPALRVLYMSGYTDTALMSQAVLDAGQVLIMKPFTAEALTRAVRQALTPTDQQPPALQSRAAGA